MEEVPIEPGEVVVQDEGQGRWVQTQRLDWSQSGSAQAWLSGHVLGLEAALEAAGEDERPVRRTQDGKWMLNLAAARQFHTQEGHLNVPSKHVEEAPVDLAGPVATEIAAVQRPDGEDALPHALIAARLCDHALA